LVDSDASQSWKHNAIALGVKLPRDTNKNPMVYALKIETVDKLFME
jgi:hypothetical protein